MVCPIIQSDHNKCVSRLARCIPHHTDLSNAAACNSQCRTDLPTVWRSKVCSVAAYLPQSNAAPVTPREPIFTKRGEDLSG